MTLRLQESQSCGRLDHGSGYTGYSPELKDEGALFPRPRRTYSPDASILLVGLRGTGRSTLALVASTSLRFRLVDLERIFHSKLGQTRAAYAATHGSDEYRRQEVELLRSILLQHPKGTVIVCGSVSVGGIGQALVRTFSKSNPVIFVLRDANDISQYVGSCDEMVISDLVKRSIPAFRDLSNFEFYNLSDPSMASNNEGFATRPSLLLKSMEKDFLQWLSLIRQRVPGAYPDKAQHSLSSVPLEKRFSTYCLSLPIEQASTFADQTRREDILADAIELNIRIAPLCSAKDLDQNVGTEITRQFFTTRRSFQLPIIIHIILPVNEEIEASLAVEFYLEVAKHALRLAPDYLTIDFHLDDVEISKIRAARGHTRIIGHYFESSSSSSSWCSPHTRSVLQRMQSAHCDIARICKTAISRTSNSSVQEFILSAKSSGQVDIPIIAYNTGRLGRPSCFTNQILTPITHPLLKDRAQHSCDGSSWLLTIQELLGALYSSYTFEPLFFGILGADVQYSLSPAMHNSAFEAFQLPHKYLTLQSSSLGDLNGLVQDSSFGGASITAPFKQEIISVLDHLSQSSRAIGAVNTVLPLRTGDLEGLLSRNETGPVVALYGDNTDWIGIFNCVRQHLSPVNAVQSNTTALVIGAGGMAHACVYSMIRLGIQTIFVCNRTEERALELANRFSGKIYSTDHTSMDGLSVEDVPEAAMCGPACVKVISSNHTPWQVAFDPPTVIVSCVPSAAQNGPTCLTVPDQWLAHKTGGVLVEVRLTHPSDFLCMAKQLYSFRTILSRHH
jgi:shikimate 5-dehydrogenase/shikimate kinase/3-dehydroquinate dehydratase